MIATAQTSFSFQHAKIYKSHVLVKKPYHGYLETRFFSKISRKAPMSDSLMSYADSIYPAGNYMFKVNNRNSRTRCELCSKLTIKIPERRHDVVLVSLLITLKHISHLVLVFILNIVHITLNVQLSAAYILCLGDSFRTRTPIFL